MKAIEVRKDIVVLDERFFPNMSQRAVEVLLPSEKDYNQRSGFSEWYPLSLISVYNNMSDHTECSQKYLNIQIHLYGLGKRPVNASWNEMEYVHIQGNPI